MENRNHSSSAFVRGIFILLGGLIAGIILFFGAVAFYQNNYHEKIYRGVSIDNVDVGGMTRQEAAEKLEREIRYPFDSSFRFIYQDKVWEATAPELGFHPQTDVMTKMAYDIGRQGGLMDQISTQIYTVLHGMKIQPAFLFDERVAFNYITNMAEEIDTPMEDPSIVLQGSEVDGLRLMV